MDTLPVQNAIVAAAPAPAAAAGGNAAADDKTAADAANPAPHRFGALLALQLGGAAPKAAKPLADTDLAADAKAATAADANTATPVDALAALNLPGLLPLAPPPSPAPTTTPTTAAHAAHATTTAAQEPAATGLPGATATDPQVLPRAANDPRDPGARMADTLNAPRAAAGQFSREAAALQTANGSRSGEPLAHAADAAANSLPQALPVPINTTPAPASVTPAQAAIEARVGTPDWNTELGQKIVWMIGDKQQVAEISVNPPDLGPLDIKLTIDGTQTTAVFTSPHSAVREAVEAAMPRLREVLADSGIMLGNASVTADTPRDSQAFADQRQGARAGQRQVTDNAAPPLPMRTVRSTRGLIDLFA